MKRVSRELWASNAFLNDDETLCYFTFLRSKTEKFPNKVTISYEIDREVTIKESELKGVLNKYLISELTVDNIMTAVFGGGESGK